DRYRFIKAVSGGFLFLEGLSDRYGYRLCLNSPKRCECYRWDRREVKAVNADAKLLRIACFCNFQKEGYKL
ncbi:hypothetical protein, partial [Clostridium sp. CAG:43]|uniref:hypothetical protein n=1 Tax=Clostridium sp. CAG:43 TaxID=1262805 RepID=UPI002584E73A